MLINFYKIHGNGNDFIIINGFSANNSEPAFSKMQMETWPKRLCPRKLGIGADGMIFLLPSPKADFEMRYYNADGSYAGMCGNGARCSVWVARQEKIIEKESHFISDKTNYHSTIEEETFVHIDFPLQPQVRQNFPEEGIFFVETGVPHIVKPVDNIEDDHFLLEALRLRHHSLLKDGANVNWIAIKDGRLDIRTFEKGVEGETLACGTGCAAAALTAANLHNIYRWECRTRCGSLFVDIGQHSFRLSGKVSPIFRGYFEIEDES